MAFTKSEVTSTTLLLSFSSGMVPLVLVWSEVLSFTLALLCFKTHVLTMHYFGDNLKSGTVVVPRKYKSEYIYLQ